MWNKSRIEPEEDRVEEPEMNDAVTVTVSQRSKKRTAVLDDDDIE